MSITLFLYTVLGAWVLLVVFIIFATWAWGSPGMRRNGRTPDWLSDGLDWAMTQPDPILAMQVYEVAYQGSGPGERRALRTYVQLSRWPLRADPLTSEVLLAWALGDGM